MPRKTKRSATDRVAGLMWGATKAIALEAFSFTGSLADEAVFAASGKYPGKKKRK
ncbi:hypothetical protein [uncultured Litoreibacter sp.]|uniref:hypothetical protein n=1 Tax=uncultured Litoreibacter sp. TaxID=1392394 RepID=UPI002637E949|nr:hypothetical protein [uncultured Litoreibacter sp.]